MRNAQKVHCHVGSLEKEGTWIVDGGFSSLPRRQLRKPEHDKKIESFCSLPRRQLRNELA